MKTPLVKTNKNPSSLFDVLAVQSADFWHGAALSN